MPIYGQLRPDLPSLGLRQAREESGEEFFFPAFVDTLYNYYDFLKRVERDYIATFPHGFPEPEQVAIIGAGQAGLVAAFELMRAGVTPVVYEASDRIGGRAWSEPFAGGNVFAEMGAMRFPRTAAFMHYLKKFDLQFGGQFPNPGEAPKTLLYYQNQPYIWKHGDSTPPGPFRQINEDWAHFVGNLGVQEIAADLMAGQYDAVKPRWQQLINKYANTSFLYAVANGIPKWGPPEFNAFGALGIGSGGFGSLYQVNFLELLRLLVNGLETEQQLLLSGISCLPDSFYTTRQHTADGYEKSLQALEAITPEAPVSRIEYRPGADKPIRLHFGQASQMNQANLEHRDFTAVIVATTTRSMQVMGMTLESPEQSAVDEEVKTSLRNLHLMNSSKMFIRTPTKFWLEDPRIPSNIQTDELPRGIYCLDYGSHTQNGVVLISYTWGDDSTKLLGVRKEKRFEIFKNTLATIAPQFAKHLAPVEGEILNVDWQLKDYYYGAFKLQYPAQDANLRNAYFQFQSVLNADNDTGLYLAGDSVSWAGGWTEGALHTGLNAACAVAKRLGGKVIDDSPLSQSPHAYNYSI